MGSTDGEIIAHAIYDPWGNPTAGTERDVNFAGIDNVSNYTGYTWDDVLGLYFAQNRFYDAENHRFTQDDPVRDGANWYVYCGNNPGTYTDPWGLYSPINLVQGTVAHLVIQGYIIAKYSNANRKVKIGVTIKGTKHTKKGIGYTDVMVQNTSEEGYEVYEIKSSTYKSGTRHGMAKTQLESYVNAINNVDSNADYKPAKKGTSLNLDGIKLLYPLDPTNKVIELSVNYSKDPGMIYYTIRDKKKNDTVTIFTVPENLQNRIEYYKKMVCDGTADEDIPGTVYAIDTYLDKSFFDDMAQWISEIKVSPYVVDYIDIFGNKIHEQNYTQITYPDGVKMYNYLGVKPAPSKFDFSEYDLIRIYDGELAPTWNDYDNTDWGLRILDLFPVIPGPIPIPIPIM